MAVIERAGARAALRVPLQKDSQSLRDPGNPGVPGGDAGSGRRRRGGHRLPGSPEDRISRHSAQDGSGRGDFKPCRREGSPEAFERILENAREYKPDARIHGLLVQEMLKPGLEVIIGVKRDPVFGPTILFGLGGVLVEVLQDVAVRAAPLREQDAWEMLEEIQGRALLGEVRAGRPGIGRPWFPFS